MMQDNPFAALIPANRRQPAPSSLLPQAPPAARNPEDITRSRLENVHLQQQIEQDNQRLTPQAIDLFAHQYLANGAMPSFGMGRVGAANRNAILNRIGAIVGADGGSGADMARAISRYHNGQSALRTLETQLGTISGNEQTARGNGEQVIAALQALHRPHDSYAITNWARNLAGNQENDPALGAFQSALNTYLAEYGKVVAGSPLGSGVLSDSARREQQDILRPTTSPDAAVAIIAQMNRDMEVRLHALQTNIDRGYQNLGTIHPISYSPQGDLQDEHGNAVPLPREVTPAAAATAPGGGPALPPGAPPLGGGPGFPGPVGPHINGGPTGAVSGGAPPTLGGAPPSEHMDATNLTSGPTATEGSRLATEGTNNEQTVDNVALNAVRGHIASMISDPSIPDEQIRQYAQSNGGAQFGNLDNILEYRHSQPFQVWQRANPGAAYPMMPLREERQNDWLQGAAMRVADSGPGTALVTGGNMLTGQNLPNIIDATVGGGDRAAAAISELRSRHPIGALAGDVGGAAELYNTGAGLVEGTLGATERFAPGLYSALPRWLTGAGGATAEDVGLSGGAAAGRSSIPALSPRAMIGDAALGSYESPGNRLEGALTGLGAGVGMRGTINTAARAISPTGGALAPAYEENVVVPLGVRMGGGANRMEQAFTSVPGLGEIQRGARNSAVNQWQLGGFNRAMRNLPGDVQLPTLTPEGAPMAPGSAPLRFTQTQFSDAYNRVHQRLNVMPAEPQLQTDLASVRDNAGSALSDASVSHFNRVLDHSAVRKVIDPSSEPLSGAELQAGLSVLQRIARTQRSTASGDPALADVLDDVTDAIHQNAARHSPPEAIETLANINKGYGMLTRIETAASRGSAGKPPGLYSPTTLMGAERTAPDSGIRSRQFSAGNGLMSNYATAGLRLGDTLPSSGTSERLAAMATMGAGAGALHFTPAAALPMAAYGIDTVGTLPIVRDIVNWGLKPNRASVRPYTDALRAQIEARSNIGSALGGPAIASLYGSGQ